MPSPTSSASEAKTIEEILNNVPRPPSSLNSLGDLLQCELFSHLGWKDLISLTSSSKALMNSKACDAAFAAHLRNLFDEEAPKGSNREVFINKMKPVFEKLKSGKRELFSLSKKLQADKDVVLAAVKQDGLALEDASEAMKANEAVVLAAVKQNGCALRFASEAMKANEAVVLAAVKQDGDALYHASEAMKDNEAVVLAAVKKYGNALYHASEAMKDNEAVVLAAVKQNGDALCHASEAMKDNEAVVLAAVMQNGYALYYASKAMKAYEAVVLAAVRKKGCALYHASEALKDNEAVVLAAVKQNGEALEYASEAMKANEAVVLAAVKQNGLALQVASEAMKANEAVVLAAVKQNGLALHHASEALKDNEAVVLAAVRKKGCALYHASKALKANEAVVLEAVKQNGYALCYASEAMRKNKEWRLVAATGNIEAVRAASKEAKDNLYNELECLPVSITRSRMSEAGKRIIADFILTTTCKKLAEDVSKRLCLGADVSDNYSCEMVKPLTEINEDGLEATINKLLSFNTAKSHITAAKVLLGDIDWTPTHERDEDALALYSKRLLLKAISILIKADELAAKSSVEDSDANKAKLKPAIGHMLYMIKLEYGSMDEVKAALSSIEAKPEEGSSIANTLSLMPSKPKPDSTPIGTFFKIAGDKPVTSKGKDLTIKVNSGDNEETGPDSPTTPKGGGGSNWKPSR